MGGRKPKPRRLVMSAIRNTRAAIDLASIMVGIIILGILGGIIAASIFAVIPWSQDNAAKAQLNQVSVAESAQRGVKDVYTDNEGLNDGGFMKAQPGLAVTPNDAGTCYVGVIVSASGHMFWISNTTPVARYDPTNLPTSSCTSPTDVGNLAAATSPVTTGDASNVAAHVNEDGAGTYETTYMGSTDTTNVNGRAWYAYYRGTYTPKQNASLPILKQLTGEEVTPTTDSQSTNLWMNVDHVHAYAGNEELKVSGANTGAQNPFYGFDFNVSYDKKNNVILYYFHNVAGTSVIGDNSDATMAKFWKNGTITFKVPGYTGTNVLHIMAQNPRASTPSDKNRLSDWTGTLPCGRGSGGADNCTSLTPYGYNWESAIPTS